MIRLLRDSSNLSIKRHQFPLAPHIYSSLRRIRVSIITLSQTDGAETKYSRDDPAFVTVIGLETLSCYRFQAIVCRMFCVIAGSESILRNRHHHQHHDLSTSSRLGLVHINPLRQSCHREKYRKFWHVIHDPFSMECEQSNGCLWIPFVLSTIQIWDVVVSVHAPLDTGAFIWLYLHVRWALLASVMYTYPLTTYSRLWLMEPWVHKSMKMSDIFTDIWMPWKMISSGKTENRIKMVISRTNDLNIPAKKKKEKP